MPVDWQCQRCSPGLAPWRFENAGMKLSGPRRLPIAQLGNGMSDRRTQVAARPAALHASDLDVAIVGGGPGGLAAATAVRTALGPDARVKVS